MNTNDPRVQGPLSAITTPAFDSIKEFQALTPLQRSRKVAFAGGFTLGFCGYLAATFGPYAHEFPRQFLLAWLGFTALGLILLIVGVRSARAPVDVISACWWGVVSLGWCWLLWNEVYPADWGPAGAFLLKGFYIAALCASAVRFFLAVRGVGGNAQKVVRQQIAQHEITWVSARRR